MLKWTKLMMLGLVAWTAGCSLLTPKFERPTLSVASVQMVSGKSLSAELSGDLRHPEPQ